MYLDLHARFAGTDEGKTAQELTSACVHCGFCLETCPTYLDNRDERDSPRGRIYLVKQMLESGQASEQTRQHLDRCLTCRSCETTCPSGVQYGRLLDIGRNLVEQQAPRSGGRALLRQLLRSVLSRPQWFGLALRLGQVLRPLLPGVLRSKIPARQQRRPVPTTAQKRSMLLLEGCVQAAATPATNGAARRVCDRLGITLLAAPRAGCCGAVNYHLAAHADGLDNMRRNIDAWWPHIENGAEAIISSASGCGSMLADYGHLLAGDPDYAHKARRVSDMAKDIGEILLDEDLQALAVHIEVGKVAVHVPCSLQHHLKLPELVPQILQRVGFDLATTRDSHLCCGSAGTYSILERDISLRLRDRKLEALTDDQPALIATANVGCQLQLAEAAGIPVVHWIELLDHC